ncbi:MAG: hypothetical protein ACR2RF_24855 [Geminicoccaceae bacterium]
MTTTALKELITEIEDGGNSRELADRVLEIYGWDLRFYNDDRIRTTSPPDPLNNLQDATLGVPDDITWILKSEPLRDGGRYHTVSWDWTRNTGTNRYSPKVNAHREPARALTLACLKAELARREMEE